MASPQTPTTLPNVLDDLTVRFLLNLPQSELESIPRLCFQVEEAQWFYEDFVRPAVAASGAQPLPSLPLRSFCLMLFQHCPLFSKYTSAEHVNAYEEFLAYKVRVPVRGAILLDDRMEKVLLVRGWKKGASWSFPRGKINKDEKDLDCAIREVYEETGYDARQAGVVPDIEEDVKYIDITMREQHMRLFVFRGVAEDTYFEPRTRKEIGKIAWYSIKDLPGFKKAKPGQPGAEAMNANKFYMVAPFLGPLKKWINAQRKMDMEKVQRNGFVAQTMTEDEAALETEEEQTPEREVELPAADAGVDESSEALKRLLSIGGSALTPVSAAPGPAKPDAHSGNLLAMLQGTSKPTNGNQQPRTPFDQIHAVPQVPETPQPDHLRHPSITQQRQQFPPPQFPFSQPGFQQHEQQRNFSLPTPNIFGPAPTAFASNPQPQSHGFHGMPPPYPQQQPFQQQRQSMPGPPPPGFLLDTQNGHGGPFNGMQSPPLPHPHMQHPHSHHQQMQFQQPPSNAYETQAPRPPPAPQGPGAIASGQAVPNASQLPPPKLNANAMKLLDAFKNSGSTAKTPAPSTSRPPAQRPASTHQTALLGLFRKPSSSRSPVEDEKQDVLEPASPALTDITVKPSKVPKRKPTLNEITRTLPAKVTSKTPVTLEPPVQAPPSPRPIVERPKEKQLFDPDSRKSVSANKDPSLQKSRSDVLQSPPGNVLQPPPPRIKRESRSPKPKHSTIASSPSRRENTNGIHPAPQFTILPRPSSATGLVSPAVPPSPLKTEGPKPAFQPQVLKRPKVSDVVQSTLEVTGQQPADKKDRLLALFRKTPAASAHQAVSPAPVDTHADQIQNLQPEDERKGGTFEVINPRTPSSTTAPAPTPPPAPRIEPEQCPTTSRQPSSSSISKQTQPQQNLLLDLFTKKASGTPITSPGTPISPFTLGTPATSQPPAEQRSRLGSLTSESGNKGVATPTETKEFLMGFLNGVVRNEGHRGAGRKG